MNHITRFSRCFLCLISLLFFQQTAMAQATPFYADKDIQHIKADNGGKTATVNMQVATSLVLLKKVTGPNGQISKYHYDEWGRLIMGEEVTRSNVAPLARDSICERLYYGGYGRIFLIAEEQWLGINSPEPMRRISYQRIYYKDTTDIITRVEYLNYNHQLVSSGNFRSQGNKLMRSWAFASATGIDTTTFTTDGKNVLNVNMPFFDSWNTSFINVRSPGSYIPMAYSSVYSGASASASNGCFHLVCETNNLRDGVKTYGKLFSYTTDSRGLVTQVVRVSSNTGQTKQTYNYEYEVRNKLAYKLKDAIQ